MLYFGEDQQRIKIYHLPTLLSLKNSMKSLHRRIKEQAEESERSFLKHGLILPNILSHSDWPMDGHTYLST
jgi:hypothetical protein